MSLIRKISIAIFAVLLLASIGLFNITAYANDDIGFYVKAIQPENQQDLEHSYFDLRVEPSGEQELEVEIVNASDEEISIEIGINNASTNPYGEVEYQIPDVRDESLKIDITDLLKTDFDLIKIPPMSSSFAKFNLSIPEEEFDGEIIGGILFTKRPQQTEGSGVNIANAIRFTVGVKLTENDNDVLPDFSLKDVYAEVINYRAAVVHEIQMPSPILIENAKLDIEVYSKGQTTPIWKQSQDAVRMAPSTLMSYKMYVDSESIDPGDYVSVVSVELDGEKWSFEKEFTVDNNKAKELYATSPTVDLEKAKNEKYTNILIVLSVIIAILIIFFVVYAVIVLNRKYENEDKAEIETEREEIENKKEKETELEEKDSKKEKDNKKDKENKKDKA